MRDSSMESPIRTICALSLPKVRKGASSKGTFAAGAKANRVGSPNTNTTITATASQFQRAAGGVDERESIMRKSEIQADENEVLRGQTRGRHGLDLQRSTRKG